MCQYELRTPIVSILRNALELGNGWSFRGPGGEAVGVLTLVVWVAPSPSALRASTSREKRER
jgi:hypothetical protein